MHHPFDLQVKLNGKEHLLRRKAPTSVRGFCTGATANSVLAMTLLRMPQLLLYCLHVDLGTMFKIPVSFLLHS